MIKWDTTKQDTETIVRICKRVRRHIKARQYPTLAMHMDITACHLNGCPLDLAAMEKGKVYDLLHDVVGIHNHINRKTGKLEGFFLPRFAVTQ